MKVLIKIVGVLRRKEWENRTRNDRLGQDLKVGLVEEVARIWFGYVQCMNNSYLPKKLLYASKGGIRSRGGPQRRY